MEEQKVVNFGIEETPTPTGEAMPTATPNAQPAQMPTPEPQIPATPTAPVMPMESQQPVGGAVPVVLAVERMEMPMQPIDLSGQSEMPMPSSGMPEEGSKKKMIVIAIVVIAGLAVGLGAFFAWRAMIEPTGETPVAERPAQAPIEISVTERVVVPVAPEPDDISVIEQELNAVNAGAIDAELQSDLNEVIKAL